MRREFEGRGADFVMIESRCCALLTGNYSVYRSGKRTVFVCYDEQTASHARLWFQGVLVLISKS